MADMDCHMCNQELPMRKEKEYEMSRRHVAGHYQQQTPGRFMGKLYQVQEGEQVELMCAYQECGRKFEDMKTLKEHLVERHELVEWLLRWAKVLQEAQLEEILVTIHVAK